MLQELAQRAKRFLAIFAGGGNRQAVSESRTQLQQRRHILSVRLPFCSADSDLRAIGLGEFREPGRRAGVKATLGSHADVLYILTCYSGLLLRPQERRAP